MTSQLDERPAQVISSPPDRRESPRGRGTWTMAAAVIAILMLGAGLVVAVALTDDARAPADRSERVDGSALVNRGGGLPAHLQEFEARTEALSTSGGLPAHLQEFEARTAANPSEDSQP